MTALSPAGKALADGMLEDQLLQLVVEAAETYGWLAYHTHDSRRSQAGFPDLVLVRRARIIFAELKKADGRTSADQRKWLAHLEATDAAQAHTVEVYLWRPADWVRGDVLSILHRP